MQYHDCISDCTIFREAPRASVHDFMISHYNAENTRTSACFQGVMTPSKSMVARSNRASPASTRTRNLVKGFRVFLRPKDCIFDCMPSIQLIGGLL